MIASASKLPNNPEVSLLSPTKKSTKKLPKFKKSANKLKSPNKKKHKHNSHTGKT